MGQVELRAEEVVRNMHTRPNYIWCSSAGLRLSDGLKVICRVIELLDKKAK